MIPRHQPPFRLPRCAAALASSAFRAPDVESLERAWSEGCGVAEAILLPSGRAGIRWALEAAGGRSLSALTSAFTCHVVHEAIMKSGAGLRLLDPRPGGFLLDERLLATAAGSSTALVLCEVYGHVYDLGLLNDLAPDVPLRIVDMAMTVPTRRIIARLAPNDVAVLSFGIGKCIYAGWGGMILTGNRALAAAVRKLRESRLSPPSLVLFARRAVALLARTLAHEPLLYRAARSVQKRRLQRTREATDPREAWARDAESTAEWHLPSTRVDRMLIRTILDRLDRYEATRFSLEKTYRKELAGLPHLIHPPESAAALSHYTVRIPFSRRDSVQRALWHAGIDTGTIFSLPSYLDSQTCPNAAKISAEVLNLPLNFDMEPSDVGRISRIVRSVS